MSRVFLNLAVFTLGVVLAFVFALRGRLVSFANTVVRNEAVGIDRLAMPTRLDPVEGRAAFLKERRAFAAKTENLEDQATVLARALDDGTPESLNMIRTEFLQVLPSYRKSLLPQLKRVALEALFKRFQDIDWREWPDLKDDVSEARKYVNRIIMVNPEIGYFVDTAGHLLHGMYVSIAAGEAYDLEQDLYYLTQNADEILKTDKLTEVAAKGRFDINFAKDPVVALSFERVKTKLTKQFAEAQPNELAAQVRLFSRLDHRAVDPDAAERLVQLLQTLALRASLQFRADVFPDIVGSQSLAIWAKNDPSVGKAMAEFYLVGVLDALEVGRKSLARKLLERSAETYSELPSRAAVEKYMNATRAQPAAAAKPGKQAPAEETAAAELPRTTEAEAEKRPAEEGGSSFSWTKLLKWLAILGLALFGVQRFLRYLARQQDELYDSNLPATVDQVKDSAPSMTDPSDIQFDVDDGGADIDFGLDQDVAKSF